MLSICLILSPKEKLKREKSVEKAVRAANVSKRKKSGGSRKKSIILEVITIHIG